MVSFPHIMYLHAPAPPPAALVVDALGQSRPQHLAAQWTPDLPRRHPRPREEAGVAGRLDQARGGDHDSLESISESFVTNTEMQKCGMLQDANSSKFKSQVQSSQRADSETRNVKTTTGDGGFSKDNHLKVTVIIDDYVNMIQFKYN